MRINEITAQAVGKWEYILNSLGVEVGSGKHCPCPVCGGKDRFRFDNKDGRGTFICTNCGSGDGLKLIQNYLRCTAKEASDKVADYLGLNNNNSYTGKPINHTQSEADSQLKQGISVADKVAYLLKRATIGQSQYFSNKGLSFNAPLLDDNRLFFPMINTKGEYTGGQFINADGNKQLMRGTNKKGSFIVINNIEVGEVREKLLTANKIIICEGVATGVTLSLIDNDYIVLSAIDCGNLGKVSKAVREINQNTLIVIGGDNDVGADKNVGLDKAIKASQDVNGFYSVPDTDHKCDWDDYRQQYGTNALIKAFNDGIKQKIKPSNISPLSLDFRLQSNTPQNKRADYLLAQYGGMIGRDRSVDINYLWTGTHWEIQEQSELEDKLLSLYEKNQIDYSYTNFKSVIELANMKAPKINQPKPNMIYFENGAYSVDLKQFSEHSRDNFNRETNGIKYIHSNGKVNLENKAPIFYQYLNNATGGDPIKFKGALSVLYLIMANRHEWHYFIEVTGMGGTGKSTFSEIARLLVGGGNVADCDINELEKTSSTRTALIDKKLLILSDQEQYNGEGALFKKISSGDKISVNPKYKNPKSFKPLMVILAINNNPMIFKGNDSGIDRRHIRVIFNEVIKPENRDPNLLDKIKAELPFLINYLLDEFVDDDKTRLILEKLKVTDEAEEIKRDNNPIYDFMTNIKTLPTADGLAIGCKENYTNRFKPENFLYHGYECFYFANYGKPPKISVKSFVKQIKSIVTTRGEIYQARMINGRTTTNLIYKDDIINYEWSKTNQPI